MTISASTPLRRWFCAAAIAAVAGCAKPPPPPPPPTIVKATLVADAGVNPDRSGRASPIVVRVFELKSLAAFDSADFFSLWDREKETLGAELVARDELLMRPGESKPIERTAQADTRFFAVIAAYRDLERASWRGSVVVAPNRTLVLRVELGARNLALARP